MQSRRPWRLVRHWRQRSRPQKAAVAVCACSLSRTSSPSAVSCTQVVITDVNAAKLAFAVAMGVRSPSNKDNEAQRRSERSSSLRLYSFAASGSFPEHQ